MIEAPNVMLIVVCQPMLGGHWCGTPYGNDAVF